MTADSIPCLVGRTVLVTRAAHQFDAVACLIRERGGQACSLPCLTMEAMPPSIQRGLALLDQVHDVVFTSTNAVVYVQQQLQINGTELATALRAKRVAAVGTATAQCLQDAGVTVHITPVDHASNQEGLLHDYRQRGLPHRLLFFRACEGSDVLQDALMAAGVDVHLIPAYRSICPPDDAVAEDVRTKIRQGRIHAVMLASSKTAAHYVQRIGSIAVADMPHIAVISPQVAAAAAAAGLTVDAVADTPAFSAMLDALCRVLPPT